MELFIVRHAQSANNALSDQRLRVVDPPLTETGLRQAELVARYLATGDDHESLPVEGQPVDAPPRLGIELLYCSAMLRALQTATPIGRALNLRPRIWTDIHEEGGMWLDEGEGAGIRGYPGMTRAEIIRQFPDCELAEDITEQGWWRFGQEARDLSLERAGRVAAKLREDARQPVRIALVTHGAFAAFLLRELIGVPRDSNMFFHHDNTAITRVRFRPDGSVSIRYQNRVDHLPPELVT